MEKKYDVYALGNALVDVQLQISEEEFAKLNIPRGSMQLVDLARQSELFEIFRGREWNRASGGSAANSMIALAQLGGRVAFGGAVGRDSWGSYYRQEMEELGISVHLAVADSQSTGTSLILITPDAERTMNTNLGAAVLFESSHVSEKLIASSEYLFLEGYLLSNDKGRGAVLAAAELANKLGTKVVVSFSATFIIDAFRSGLEKLVEQSYLVIANSDEAKTYAGVDDEELAFAKLREITPNVVMTQRERGARVYYEGNDFQVGTPQVNAVDETGAGDVFAGAFLYGISRANNAGKGDARESAALACFLASRVVMSLGPRLSGNIKMLLKDNGFGVTDT